MDLDLSVGDGDFSDMSGVTAESEVHRDSAAHARASGLPADFHCPGQTAMTFSL